MAGPNFGPDCADPSLLDPDHCPSDVITSGYWKQSWFGLPFFQGASKKRFTYDRDTGKCWDYTDCYCTGCGVTFKSDTTKGIGFTGYGYWTTNGGWVPFAKPMASMSGHEKAQQCQAAMLAGGITCPAESVNLVCFNAGGYPKQVSEIAHLLSHLHIKTIILPRQARDKRRESTQKQTTVCLAVVQGLLRNEGRECKLRAVPVRRSRRATNSCHPSVA
jgi:hypothetical protein